MELIFTLESFLWSGPLLVLLMGCHLYFTIHLKGIQRYTLRGIRLSLSAPAEKGGVSAFGALSTSLAAAIGTGNIIGMATAILLGGPGAVFWCWVTGVLGMATRYGENILTLRYRRQLPDGSFIGGPMYVLEEGLNRPWVGRLFSILGVAAALGTGAMIQSNAVGVCLGDFGISRLLSGLLLSLCAGAIILGGVKTIASVCEKMVPAMGIVYLLGCIVVLYVNRNVLGETFRLIFSAAFVPRAFGGGFVGSTLTTAIRYGTARGLFTNESGMGTGPMAAATGPCRNFKIEALVSMTGVFWDTVVICAMTGVTLVSAVIAAPELYEGAGAETLCRIAFSCFPGGNFIVTLCLCVFAFATVVGWSWYGECCARYLWGEGSVILYRFSYLAAAFCGVFVDLEALWSLGDILAGLMAVPNVLCLFRLRGEIHGLSSASPFGVSG